MLEIRKPFYLGKEYYFKKIMASVFSLVYVFSILLGVYFTSFPGISQKMGSSLRENDVYLPAREILWGILHEK